MAAVQSADALFDSVARSGLLAPERLAPYRAAPEAADPIACARALVRDRLLTPFQARQLVRGKYRGFFLSDKYKVLEELGSGGMGRVLLCEHLLLHKLVAVKLLNASWTQVPGAEERFFREARAAAAVDHSNIVRVHDVDRAQGVPFIVMEFVDGTNLHQLVTSHGPLSVPRAVEYARQTALGLQAAYRAGLIHRDIKPGNLILDRDGQVKVADLGLARFMADETRNRSLTERFDPGTVLGTLDFIAPEQADNSSAVDIRADLYSLGHTLYFLLTAKLPFGEGSAAQKLIWHQGRHPEPLSAVRAEVPEPVEAVFAKMTAKAPADRYQTPAECAAALAALLADPVPPPDADEMPKLRGASFVLGLAPHPPAPDVLAPPAPETPYATGSTTVLRPGPRRRDAPGSDVLHSITEPGSDGTGRELIPTPHSTAPAAAARPARRAVLLGGGAVALAGVAGLTAWALRGPGAPEGGPEPKPNPNPPPTGPTLAGEGSSFVEPMMQRWAALYRARGTAVEYKKTGSTNGVRALLSKTVRFACTDAYLTDPQLLEATAAGGPVVHVPLVMGAVVATYNLPNVEKPLRFTEGALADMFLGKIAKWNHPALVACNPGVALPDLDIAVIHRADGSGTTFIWTDYLSTVNPEWKRGPGTGPLVKWPVGTGEPQNDGVARAVSRKEGAIGYVELGYALARNLPAAHLENAAGAFVAPNLASVTAAAQGELANIPADLRFTLTNAKGAASYPVCGTTWAVLFQNQPAASGKELVEFLRWAVGDGQAHVSELNYAPLPKELLPRVAAALDSVTVGK